MKRTFGLAAAVALVIGVIQAQGQSVIYTFADATSDGWANSGFGSTPAATVATIGSQNYIFLPLGGFQVGNVGHGNDGSDFFNTMAAAQANPAGYNVSYDWYVNSAAFTGATFLQIGSFVNDGSGDYSQDFPASGKEVELNGTQLASGQVFSGHVSVNMGAAGLTLATPGQTFYRLGLIENGNGTGTGVYFTNISVAPVPEPGSLALIGLGMASLIMIRRRHS